MRGYAGKILNVDLTTRTWTEETLPDEIYEQNLSGVGLGAYILNRRLPPGADPLGPEAILGFVAGILCGTGAMFAGRWMAVGKSPLTGGWGDANCGGNFGAAIKQCGYDAVFVSGIASAPVYLFADGKSVEIRPAQELWGRDAVETEEVLAAACGKKARVACIGPAGEALSLISGIVNDRGRLAARSGLGAVMGSKKLKAVVLAGSMPVKPANPQEMHRLSKQVAALMPKGNAPMPSWVLPIAGWFLSKTRPTMRTDGLMSLAPMKAWGTSSGNEVCIINGDSPIRNWRGTPSKYPSGVVSAAAMVRSQVRKYHCNACPLGCGAINRIPGTQQETHRPEYETVSGFGPLVLNRDLTSIFAINELLNRAGMDSISSGVTVAFAIDCFEHGLLSEADTGGLNLRWGDSEAITRLVQMMVKREGLGDVLADGVARAAGRIGKGSQQYAFHAGGQELPMHDPRHDPGYGVFYTADPTPGRHTIGSNMQYELYRLWSRVSWAPEVPRMYNPDENYRASQSSGLKLAACGMAKMVADGGGFCTIGMNAGVDRMAMFEYLNAATGWNKTPDEYMEIGRQVQTQRQLFNIRQGIQPAAVGMPGLLSGSAPVESGPLKGKQFDLPAMRRSYWQAMHWDPETGCPPNASKPQE